MRPLHLAAFGILVVALDLNLEHVDLLFDPVGYGMVLAGVQLLADRHLGFRLARVAAAVGLVASLFTALLRRVETTTTGDPSAGLSWTRSEVVEPMLPTLVESLSQAAFVYLVCGALVAVGTDPRVRAPASTLRIALPVVSLVSSALGLYLWVAVDSGGQLDGPEGVAAAFALGLGLLGLVLAIWFFIVLLRAAREPGLQRAGAMIPG